MSRLSAVISSTQPTRNLDGAIRKARIAANIREDYFYPFDLYWEIKDADVKSTFLSTVSTLLGPGSVDDLLDHIDYIVKRVGDRPRRYRHRLQSRQWHQRLQ